MAEKYITYFCKRCGFSSKKEFKDDECPACGNGKTRIYSDKGNRRK